MHWRRKWQPTPVFLPGECQGPGSLVGWHLWGRRVGDDWSNLAAANTSPSLMTWPGMIFTIYSPLPWRRQWHPTPVLLPGKSHGWRSLVGCSPWGRQESGTTERLHFDFSLSCIGEGNGNPLQYSCLENPRNGEPSGLLSMGSHKVGHDWSDLAAAAATAAEMVKYLNRYSSKEDM